MPEHNKGIFPALTGLFLRLIGLFSFRGPIRKSKDPKQKGWNEIVAEIPGDAWFEFTHPMVRKKRQTEFSMHGPNAAGNGLPENEPAARMRNGENSGESRSIGPFPQIEVRNSKTFRPASLRPEGPASPEVLSRMKEAVPKPAEKTTPPVSAERGQRLSAKAAAIKFEPGARVRAPAPPPLASGETGLPGEFQMDDRNPIFPHGTELDGQGSKLPARKSKNHADAVLPGPWVPDPFTPDLDFSPKNSDAGEISSSAMAIQKNDETGPAVFEPLFPSLLDSVEPGDMEKSGKGPQFTLGNSETAMGAGFSHDYETETNLPPEKTSARNVRGGTLPEAGHKRKKTFFEFDGDVGKTSAPGLNSPWPALMEDSLLDAQRPSAPWAPWDTQRRQVLEKEQQGDRWNALHSF